MLLSSYTSAASNRIARGLYASDDYDRQQPAFIKNTNS